MALENIYQTLASPKLSSKDKRRAVSLLVTQIWHNWEALAQSIMKEADVESLYISVIRRNTLISDVIRDAELGGVGLLGDC